MEKSEKPRIAIDKLTDKYLDPSIHEHVREFIESYANRLHKVVALSHSLHQFLLDNETNFNFANEESVLNNLDLDDMCIIWSEKQTAVTPKHGNLVFEYSPSSFLVREKRTLDILFRVLIEK
jgi:hypothetical protein